MPERFDIAVVGGGAAGLVAAISGARRGASVTVLERLSRAGKKLLATGGGRCNLLNENLAVPAFTSSDPDLVASILDRFGKTEIRTFFETLGLRLKMEEDGRIYPATNQASSVLKVLELEVGRLGIPVELGFEASGLTALTGGFSVASAAGRTVEARTVILAGGGRAYPALGSNGSCYGLARLFGHSLVPPVPSAVPLLAKDGMCHFLQGQKLMARIASVVDGRVVRTVEGELLFTQYGLSGTAALDVSESLSIAINREGTKDTAVIVDLIPFMPEEDLAAELSRRIEAGWSMKDLGSGLLPEKFAQVMPQFVRDSGASAGNLSHREGGRRLAAALKARKFAVQGTRGWNEAEFTSGGVDAREVKPRTLESKLRRGLYLAGEVLDVQGGRGGYNLAWAWASGFVAGLTE
ncbi:MAG: aminoacetone oxidase family FAD-binding enzyme [Candidatus Aminicenantes bacterium]|nr:aminoacetone oxidase family FAD-binding enzyme [Candidatus Aminicenantes bacterium]